MRVSPAEIKKLRNEQTGRIFITGATGLLGSHLVKALAEAGHKVTVLVRPKTGRDRFHRIVRWLEIPEKLKQSIHVIEGDLLAPSFGLPESEHASLAESVREIIHCAADTSFSQTKHEQVEAVNVGGMQNVLELAGEGGCLFFHHVSTAFVTGKTRDYCPEELTGPSASTNNFNNPYEETKYKAEHLAADFCRDAGIRLNMYRPSIVYGNSVNGKTFRFNALYHPLRAIHRLYESYRADLHTQGGKNAGKVGVHREDNGALFFPLSVPVKRGCGINIIPIDFFISTFLKIFNRCTDGNIFHIVQKQNTKIEDIVAYTARYFSLEGLKSSYTNGSKAPLDKLFSIYNKVYMPYFQDSRKFSFDHVKECGIIPYAAGAFTFEQYRTCMDYALQTEWGAKLGF
jgi:nucleoside-diphosphate-sugar epimerase